MSISLVLFIIVFSFSFIHYLVLFSLVYLLVYLVLFIIVWFYNINEFFHPILICVYAVFHLINKTNYYLNIEELLQLLK